MLGLGLQPGSLVLDVAAGTGSITRSLRAAGHRVVALDQSPDMLARFDEPGGLRILATAEHLPLPDGSVDGVTSGYLLRYVADLPGAIAELARVVRPGGVVAALDFGRPRGLWGPLWWLYTRLGLPLAGAAIGHGWWEVGRFLGPSIDRFWSGRTPEQLAAIWGRVGLDDVRWRSMSLGGGFLIWGRRT